MSGLTQDLLPRNILTELRALERRVRALEMALTAGGSKTEEMVLVEAASGRQFRLEVEYIDDVLTLWLVEKTEQG